MLRNDVLIVAQGLDLAVRACLSDISTKVDQINLADMVELERVLDSNGVISVQVLHIIADTKVNRMLEIICGTVASPEKISQHLTAYFTGHPEQAGRIRAALIALDRLTPDLRAELDSIINS